MEREIAITPVFAAGKNKESVNSNDNKKCDLLYIFLLQPGLRDGSPNRL